jgi:tRNA U34 5-carboxymethylaminomethyl modifying GTPase MnmE/TrmE
LAAQYVNFKDNELSTLNVAKFHASIRALNQILEEFEQKSTEEREMIRTGANIVLENRPDERGISSLIFFPSIAFHNSNQ